MEILSEPVLAWTWPGAVRAAEPAADRAVDTTDRQNRWPTDVMFRHEANERDDFARAEAIAGRKARAIVHHHIGGAEADVGAEPAETPDLLRR